MGLPPSSHLLAADDSVLLVIDVQERFLARLAPDVGAAVVGRIAWLVEVAKHLAVPVIATAEDIPAMGVTVADIERRLPSGTSTLNKQVFGLADDTGVFPAVDQFSRRTAVLVGFETDICVAHSALGLLDRGFRVAVVGDAVASPGPGHEQGLARLRNTGVVETSTKGIHYEWLRTVERANRARAALAGIVEVPAELRW